MPTKPCVRCNEIKDYEEFYKRAVNPTGRTAHCKDCGAKARGHNRRITKPNGFDGVSKICTSCDTRKPLEEFYNNKKAPHGRTQACAVCLKAQIRIWYEENNLMWRYNITQKDYDLLLQEQGGHCATCPSTTKLVVDHDHSCCPGRKSCGKCVRGVLCNSCNTALGNVGDDPEILETLAAYLRRGE